MRRPRSAPPTISREEGPAPNRYFADDCSSDSESDEEMLLEKLKEAQKDCQEWRRLAFHETQKLNYRRVHHRERPFYDECHLLYALGEQIDYNQQRKLLTYPPPTISVVDRTGVRSSTPPPRNDLTEMFRRKHPKRLVKRFNRLKHLFFRLAHLQSRLNDEIREKHAYDK